MGIIENAPANSHIQYSMLVSNLSNEDLRYFEWSWVWCNLVTYVKLYPEANPELLEAKFPDLVKNNAGYAIERLTGKPIDDFFEKGNRLGYMLEPLSEVYYSEFNPLGSSGSRTFIYIFSIVAFTILLLASINYTNLTTARSLKRAKEIGLRKVVGTTRLQLYMQFLTESVLFSMISTIIAIGMYEAINNLMINYFDIRWNLSLMSNLHFVWFIAGLALIVGVVSGLYPAIYLSSFNPARSLKGLQNEGQAKSPMRNSLIVFQFLISFCIIIFTFTVNAQIEYLRNRDLGFDKENLAVISNISQLQSQNVFKEEVNRQSSSISSTLSSHVPSRSARGELFKKMDGERDDFIANLIDADQDFIKTFGLKINTGQNFTSLDINSQSPKVLINGQARKSLELEDPLGFRIMGLDDGRILEIGGIVDDFDYFLSQEALTSMIIRPLVENSTENIMQFLTVKVSSENLPATIAELEKIWNTQETGIPFEYRFYDQIFNDMYLKQIRLGNLLSLFSGLAITIAILGLIGLISFHTEQLKKSIGIRKVLGATIPNILGLITKDFARLFIIAFVISVPIANYAIEDWLETFVNRISVNPWLFAVPGAVVLGIALLTIWIQSFKSASANPVDSIRNE
jgi:putative ABC transport system permease protein